MKELDAIAIVHDAQDRRGYLLAKERRQVHRNALPIIRARALALKKESALILRTLFRHLSPGKDKTRTSSLDLWACTCRAHLETTLYTNARRPFVVGLMFSTKFHQPI